MALTAGLPIGFISVHISDSPEELELGSRWQEPSSRVVDLQNQTARVGQRTKRFRHRLRADCFLLARSPSLNPRIS